MRNPEPALIIKSRGIAADQSSQAYFFQRIGGKLGKFGRHIRALDIQLKRTGCAEEEPRVSCSLSLTLAGGEHLAVERCGLEAREAFDHTMGVAERLVRRTLQRLRHQ